LRRRGLWRDQNSDLLVLWTVLWAFGVWSVGSSILVTESISCRANECVCSFQEAENGWSQREEALRKEIADIENKLHLQEADFSDAIASTSEGTQPLLRYVSCIGNAMLSRNRKSTCKPDNCVHRLNFLLFQKRLS